MTRQVGDTVALTTLRERLWTDAVERDRLIRQVVGGPGGENVSVLTGLMLVEDDEVQRAALIRLKRLGNPTAVDALLRQVPGHPSAVVQQACEKLALIAPPGSAQRASWFLTSGIEEVRQAAETFILTGALDRDVLGVVLSWLHPDIEESRISRTLALLARDLVTSDFGRPEIDEALRRAARHPSPSVRQDVYRLLARGGRRETLRFFVECYGDEVSGLQTQLEGELRASLPALGAKAGEAITGLLISARPADRKLGAAMLASQPNMHEAVCSFFASARELPSWARRRGALALAPLHERLITPLGAMIEEGPGEWAEAATQAACELDLVAALEPELAGALSWGSWSLRWLVADALGRRGGTSSIDSLAALLSDEHTADIALVALARIAGRLARQGEAGDAVEALREHQALLMAGLRPSPEPAPARTARRMTIVEELALVELEEVFWWLSASAEQDTDRSVRKAAWRSALKIGRSLQLDTSRVELAMERLGRDWPEEASEPLDQLFMDARQQNATELKLSPGREPMLRLDGRWERLVGRGRWTHAELASWLRDMLDERHAAELSEQGHTAFVRTIDRLGLFRGHLYVDAQGINAVFRAIAEEPLSLGDVGLGGVSSELLTLRDGIGLIVAPQAQGKSTTANALTHALVEERHALAVVLCQANEYPFSPRRGALVVRQQGEDFDDVGVAVGEALLLGADILVLDGLDDVPTLEAAVEAARRGILVLVTTSGMRIDQGIAPWRSHLEPRLQPLSFVICQRLIPRDDGVGLATVSEVALRSTRGSDLSIAQPFKDALHARVESGVFTLDTARRQLDRWQREHARARRGGDDGVIR